MSWPAVLLALLILALVFVQRSGWRSARRGVLEEFSKDLTALARKGELDPVIGREEEIRRVIQTLGRRSKDNVILVGKAGVGKSAIVEGLAQAIVAGRVPPSLRQKQVLALDLNALVAGTKYRGEFEKRMMGLTEEIRRGQRRFIIFIDEMHALTGAGEAGGSMSAGDILKPALARGELQAIGATTPLEYEKYIKQDPTLERRLQPVLVREPSSEETLKIIHGIVSRYEAYHDVVMSDEAMAAAVELSQDYLPDRSFPDKAIDLMDEAASMVRLDMLDANAATRPTVTRRDVEAVVSSQKQNSFG